MVTFFVSNLGKIELAVVSLASLSWAHFLITGQYCDQWSLMRMVIFKLTSDCASCFAVVLGHQAVLCLLQYIWGWSATILVIFDLIMTPLRIGLLRKQEGFLPCDSTSSPESYLGNIAQVRELDGTKKYLWDCALLLQSHIEPMPLERLQLPPCQNWQKCLGNTLRWLEGQELQGGSRSFKTDLALNGVTNKVFMPN